MPVSKPSCAVVRLSNLAIQLATPIASSAAPARRPTNNASAVAWSNPRRTVSTTAGRIRRLRPVAISTKAVTDKNSLQFRAYIDACPLECKLHGVTETQAIKVPGGAARTAPPQRFLYPPLVSRPGESMLHGLLFVARQLHRPKVDGQFVDLTVERERHLVVLVVDTRACIDSDIEGFVGYLQEGDRVGLLARGDNLAVHLQLTAASLGNAGTGVGVIKHDRVLARRECVRSFPAVLREDEHVVVKHRLAVEQVEAPAAPAAAGG